MCDSPGPEYLEIKGLKLPTIKQVLLCFLAHLKHLREGEVKRGNMRIEAANIVTIEIVSLYDKASIPVLSERSIQRKIFELHDKYLSLKKSAGKERKNDPVTSFFNSWDKTAEFWPKAVFEIMENNKRRKTQAEVQAIEEDMEFLRKMQTDREATFGRRDLITPKIKAIRSARNEKEKERNKKTLGKVRDSFVYEKVVIEPDFEPDFVPDEPSTSTNAPVKRSHQRKIKTGCTISIPHDILKDPDVVSLYTRHNVSHTFMCAMLFTIISKCGGDPNHISLSASTSLR